MREIYAVDVSTGYSMGSTDVEVRITGSGFLYNMVRTIVGTMLDYAFGSLTEDDVKKSFTECDRESVGKTLCAKGLTLESVDYGFNLFEGQG